MIARTETDKRIKRGGRSALERVDVDRRVEQDGRSDRRSAITPRQFVIRASHERPLLAPWSERSQRSVEIKTQYRALAEQRPCCARASRRNRPRAPTLPAQPR